MDFKSTLNLPDPNFTIPMKADLANREPVILHQWDYMQLYHRRMVERAGGPTFILHDGPPYTNGPLHLGTSLNNIVKDFVLKSRFMLGYQTPFVPGYDNHGLPIEQAVMKKFAKEKVTPTVPELRKACREHAAHFIDLQTTQRSRLGVFGLWEKPYTTMNYRFEAEIIRVFKRLVQEEYVYRGLKPTLWSPSSQTALADTEIVYKEHTSTSIYVRFPLLDDHNGWSKELPGNIFCVIWTTTPWTIPANLAVAFHPTMEYAAVTVGGDTYILLKDLVPAVAKAVGWENYEIAAIFLGATFEFSKFKHPIFDRESLGVLADYVTMDDGTGVVHTAPGHGREDFLTGAKYGLPILCPVDARGILTEEAGEFAGQHFSACDTTVVDRIREKGNLLRSEPHVHQYPYAERDSKPVIFRATEQWFVSVDNNDLRQRMLGEIEKVKWHPASAEARIRSMISGRPDWCISRQRPWGVGIPVFYGKESGSPVLDPEAIEAVAQLVEAKGSDAWYTTEASDILPKGYRHPVTGETEFVKETDVFDVWFDSGSSWAAVLEGNVEPEWKAPLPADLYLEGSDQHRGWFNVSLILSTAITLHAPYKEVVTHGFVNDESGSKMSKRDGNAIDPIDVCNRYGADVLRFWVGSVNFTEDAPCSDDLLKTAGEGYRKIRNTLRFLLSNLEDYAPENAPAEFLPIDEWIVEQTDLLADEVVKNFQAYAFRDALSAIHNFCVNELSSFYIDAIKDRMYCDGPNWPSRRSAQAACAAVLQRLTLLIAPILPFTAEEVYHRLPLTERKDSVHLEQFIIPNAERLAFIEANALQQKFANLLEWRSAVFVDLEQWKSSNGVKNSQDIVVHITDKPENLAGLQSFDPNELANLFKVSWVHLAEGEPNVTFEPSPYPECERSRIRRPDVEQVGENWLSKRDRVVLNL